MIFFGLGLLGLYFEFSNPGLIFPGVVGGIFLILAFFGLQILPINYAGLALIILALIFFLVEVKVTSYGLLTIAGIISMVLGSIMLFETPIPELRVSLRVIIPVAVALGVMTVFLLRLVVKAQKRKAVTGSQGLIGKEGKCLSDIAPEGKVFLHGEIWDAVSPDQIVKGDHVEVTGLKGFILEVKKKH
jgi:membrane-bound serine protease (ClpP class)